MEIFHLSFILPLLIILAALSFLFSASETSIIGLSRIRLRHMLARGVRNSKSIQGIITRLDKFIVLILTGNNFVNIAISAIITGICVLIFGYKWGIIISTFTCAFFILIFCEITPKILATKYTERIAILIAPVMEALIRIFGPLLNIFIGISNFLIKIFRIKPGKRSPLITEEELRLLVEIGQEEGFLSAQEGRMLQRIFEFGDIKVSDVMIPKDKMVAVDIKSGAQELLDIFVEEGHARLPVYEGSLDKITGIVYARDLLYILRDKGLFLLQDLIHPPYYVGPAMQVHELLKRFQEDKIQIAIVVDKEKKALGLVTLEDLIEEIVGDIEEKHSASKPRTPRSN
ncbi:MAG: hemolysin family protein [Candidatus Omnitrophica bacterium]|nr:hemolysin family protein [Candidatus Omnitrophota bacterium]